MTLHQFASDGSGASDFESHDYSEFWRERTLDDLAQKRTVRSWLPQGGSCIELGGGFGRLTGMLCARFRDVTMLELGARNLKQAKRRVPEAFLIKGDASTIPVRSDEFDCAVMVRVVHLLSDPARTMEEIGRVVKDGGTVIVSEPNLTIYNLAWKLKGLLYPVSIRTRSRPYGSAVWPAGTLPNLSPLERFLPPEFTLRQRSGTGWLDNFLGKKLRGHPRLYLVDVATSPLWFFKFDVFLKLRVHKAD